MESGTYSSSSVWKPALPRYAVDGSSARIRCGSACARAVGSSKAAFRLRLLSETPHPALFDQPTAPSTEVSDGCVIKCAEISQTFSSKRAHPAAIDNTISTSTTSTGRAHRSSTRKFSPSQLYQSNHRSKTCRSDSEALQIGFVAIALPLHSTVATGCKNTHLWCKHRGHNQ